MMRIHSLLVCALLLLGTCARAQQCAEQRSIRKLSGPSPVTSELRDAAREAPTNVFFDEGQFVEERFTYVGRVERSGKAWQVAMVETSWGCSARLTPRLLVFRDGHYFGQYSHFGGRHPRVERDAIIFDDVSAGDGNAIRFKELGPPNKVRIDGEDLTLYQ